MTTTQTTAKKKAHDDGVSFLELINDLRPPTPQELASEPTLAALYDMGKGSNQSQNQLFMIDTDHSIVYSNGIEKEALPQGAIAALMQNNKGEAVNLAYPNPNSRGSFQLLNSNIGAYVFGTLTDGCELIAAKSFLDGEALARHLPSDKPIIISPNEAVYYPMVKDFSKKFAVIALADSADTDDVCRALDGFNVKVITTEIGVINDLELGGLSYNHIVNDPKTSVKRLLKSDEWADPEPLANDPSEPTAYPIHAFNGLLRRVIEWVAYYAQVPLAMAGQCVLGALAHMGQRFVDAPLGHEFKPASLILITEGESGSGKTQAMSLTHFKIEQHERQKYEQYEQDLEVWETDKAALKGAELKEYLSTTPKPYNPETVFKEATIEPILDKFVDGEVVNGSWATDDAAQFFNGHSMTSKTAGNALTSFTDLYSGSGVNRTRSQKNTFANPRTKAYGVRFTLMLMAQRIILEPALTDPLMNGQGFLARALIACPPDLRGQRVWNDAKRRRDNPYDNPDLIAYWERCQSLLDPAPANEPTTAQGQPERIKMRWADDATEQAFYEQMQVIENNQKQGSVFFTIKAYASRMAENASRIATLIAFFEGRKVITKDDITRAFLLVEYSTSERLRYLDATPTGEQNDSEKLSSWLVSKAKDKKPHKLGRTYIANNAPSPLRKSSKLLQIELDKLESANHIKQETEGRSKVVFINPKLFI